MLLSMRNRHGRRRGPAVALAYAFAGTMWGAAQAQASEAAAPVFGVAGLGSNAGAGLSADAGWRFAGGQQLGIALVGEGLWTAHLGGQVARGVSASGARAFTLSPLLTTRALELDLRLSSGLRYLRDVGALESHRDALRSTTELALLAHVNLGEHYLLRTGVLLGFDLELSPTTSLADQSQSLTLGVGRVIGDSTLLYASVDAGGSYGFDGDNGKAILRGALGLRFPLGGDARTPF
jgi:hypothetical protein